MTHGTPSPRNQTHARSILAGPSRRRAFGELWNATVMFLALIMGSSILLSSPPVRAEDASPMLLSQMISQKGSPLASIDSDESAQALFTATIGPALGLNDAARAIGAKRLSGKLVKELRLTDLSQSISELMAALAVWQFADSIAHDEAPSTTGASLRAAQQDWVTSRSKITPLADLFRLIQTDQRTEPSHATVPPKNTELLLAATRTALEASQKATAAWWDIYWWKERIRQAKGRARLCGTWQWIIHNHQIHGEQKSTVMFPPLGQVSAQASAPTEIIVLGDAIYLRWEHNGQLQEDSLLFIKDDAKIEGSFVNNMGGWGPISAKRMAPCQP
ncbi:hypothetical protein [Candidatus Nitrospira nitrificans]|uniref:Uncharacterized protein n=1 Tax=Candidatus Nitrospira nitrificans TaxID=1742973 RepID=A0A0S4L7T0_9BACT|nr:hypothetical protein [Candidatus Nitrospira nitrificans]CUS32826.1 conserved exported hypothetical protein [Candidatus Nitrospira nitrificans]